MTTSHLHLYIVMHASCRHPSWNYEPWKWMTARAVQLEIRQLLSESEPSAWPLAAATAVAAKRRGTLTLSAWCAEACAAKLAARARSMPLPHDSTGEWPSDDPQGSDPFCTGPKQASCSRHFCLHSTEWLRFCPSWKHPHVDKFLKNSLVPVRTQLFTHPFPLWKKNTLPIGNHTCHLHVEDIRAGLHGIVIFIIRCDRPQVLMWFPLPNVP